MSNVKIKANASGTADFTIQAPATDSALTLTLPSVDGELLTTNGDGSNLTGVGKVLQVVTAFKSDVASTTSTSFTDVGMNLAITPSSTSSKILVLCDAKFGGATGNLWFVRMLRDSTPIGVGDAAGSRTQAMFETDGSGQTIHMFTVGMNYVDSPATTSAVTYKLQFKGYSGNAVYLNRTGQDRDPNDVRTGSSITLLEIAG